MPTHVVMETCNQNLHQAGLVKDFNLYSLKDFLQSKVLTT